MLLMRVHRFDSVSLFSFCFSAWAVFPLFSYVFGRWRFGSAGRRVINMCMRIRSHLSLFMLSSCKACRHSFRFNLLSMQSSRLFFFFCLSARACCKRSGSAPPGVPIGCHSFRICGKKRQKNREKSRKKTNFQKNRKKCGFRY